MECAHENGNPLDNRPENLSWKTRVDNHADKERHGTKLIGERVGNSKLTESDVRNIRRLRSEGTTYDVIARQFGVSAPHVHDIVKRKSWAWLLD